MDILKQGDEYYVKFEMFFEQEFSSSLIVRFTGHISLILDEYDIWNKDEPAEINRSSNETELLSKILDALLVDRYISSPYGLLESIGGGSTHLALHFSVMPDENAGSRSTKTRMELEAVITQVVNRFLKDQAAVPA